MGFIRTLIRTAGAFWLGMFGALAVLRLLATRAGLNRVDDASDELRLVLIFDGAEVSSRSTAFRGGGGVCAFGGVQLDLSAATLAEGATLRIGCAFGGAQIVVPEGMRVTSEATSAMGGVSDDTRNDDLPDDAPHLHIEALALFGGVSISRKRET